MAHSGVSVLTPSAGATLPTASQMRKVGTIVTAPGSIIVASTRPNRKFRKGNRK
jgi:hypothetical protein